jgi:hypothetical protein
MSDDLRLLIPAFMLWVLLPVWVVAGIADYLLHRRTRIECTSGWGESRLHVLQALEIGVPLLAGLFLEINGLVVAIMIVFVVAHTLTALWDASYTAPLRDISPIEQHVHSHLEYVPLVAVALVTLLYWNTLGSFELRLKTQPLPVATIMTVLILVFGVQGFLLLEEALRSRRVDIRPQ